jgi:CheY-like chemotaxis protein
MEVVFRSGYTESAFADRGILDFTVTYLSKPFSPEALATKLRQAPDSPRSCGIVLVVDDDPAIHSLLRTILAGVGYDVLEAADGKQALQQFDSCEVDLVLTDLAMPDVDGLETIQLLRKKRPQLKIIAFSGRFGSELLRTAELLGAQATLAKPIQPEQLLETVRRVMAG